MRIVVKIGTSTITYATGHLNIRHMEKMIKVLSDIKNAGNELILVSSGAIAMGVGKLNLPSKPEDIPSKQAVAAVGQCELMNVYNSMFSKYNHIAAQVLLTAEDAEDDNRKVNISNTMERLLALHVIPVVNENDTVATAEIHFGDNDTLAAVVSKAVKADLLILFSDIDGLYTSDPHKDSLACIIPEVSDITEEIEKLAGGAGSARGTGGMVTKIRAAKMVTSCGTDMIIANGNNPEVLYDILEGKYTGTRFIGKKQ